MKKFVCILFIITQLFSLSDIKLPSNTLHSHSHLDSAGIKHLHEHSHVEHKNTLFFQIQEDKNINYFTCFIYEKRINLNSQLIIYSIFRPPISKYFS